MRFNGKKLEQRNRREVVFYRGSEKLSLVVGAVSQHMIAEWRAKQAFKWVDPPEVAAKLPNGQYDRDEKGLLKYRPNESDPNYLSERRTNFLRLSALKLWYGLRYADNFQFDAKPPEADSGPQEWQAFADALVKEIADPESGFEDGELDLLIKGIEACDVVVSVNEDDATKLFS